MNKSLIKLLDLFTDEELEVMIKETIEEMEQEKNMDCTKRYISQEKEKPLK